MGLIDFYNNFHKKSQVQSKLISADNFTYRQAIDVLKKYSNGKSLKVLDYGCGQGTMALYLANKGHKVIGVDISEKAVKVAKKSAKLLSLDRKTEFITLNKSKPRLANEKFDLILCIEVIEHVKDDKKLIRFFARHLKKSGTLIISTPSINAPLHKLGLAKDFDKKVGHLRRYKTGDLVNMVEAGGLKVKEVIKTEGIIRNSLFIVTQLGMFVRFIRGPISDIVTIIDKLTVKLFGESDIFIVSSKI